MKLSDFDSNLKVVRMTFSILLFIMLVATTGRLVDKAALNIANTILNRAFWQDEIAATRRQYMLSWAATLLDIAHVEEIHSDHEVSQQCSMIPAMIIADYNRKQKRIGEALTLLRCAVDAEPIPAIQGAILVPARIEIDQQGNLILNWADSWRFRKDSQVAETAIEKQPTRLILSYENTLEKRDKVIYQWSGPLSVSYWQTLEIKAKIHPGTYFTLEVHSDEGVQRYINYHEGQGEWEDFKLRLTADNIGWIYISLTEPSDSSTVSHYRIDMLPVEFVIDKN